MVLRTDDPQRELSAADATFSREGGVELDAYHFARAAGAVLAVCDEPTLQLEIFDGEGILIVATDTARLSLLRAWVPLPDDDGWKATSEIAGPGPGLDEKPDLTVTAALGPIGVRVLAELAKPKRAKYNAKEHLTVEWGEQIDGGKPTLGGDLKPRIVRFVTDEGTFPAPDPQNPFDWRQLARDVEDGGSAVLDYGQRISGDWAIAFGKIANALGTERDLLISPARLGDQPFTRVRVPGFPAVRGFGVES